MAPPPTWTKDAIPLPGLTLTHEPNGNCPEYGAAPEIWTRPRVALLSVLSGATRITCTLTLPYGTYRISGACTSPLAESWPERMARCLEDETCSSALSEKAPSGTS